MVEARQLMGRIEGKGPSRRGAKWEHDSKFAPEHLLQSCPNGSSIS